ncbi:hypothetical protein ACOMHN_003524 [Nucella lapillus]
MSAASANMSTPSLLPGSVAPAPNAPGHPMGEVSSAMYYTVAAILSVFCVLGTFFNGGALAVYWTHRPLRTPTNSFVIALCVCDLFMCLIGMPIPAGYAWARTSIRSRAVCLLDGFTVYFFSQSSLFLLAAISVDRYIVIVRPLIAPVITHRLAGMAIAVCFLLGLFWAAVPMLGWNRYVLEGIGVACSVSWQPGPDAGHTSYILAIFVCCFLLPLLAITFCYVGIYRAVSSLSTSTGRRVVSASTGRAVSCVNIYRAVSCVIIYRAVSCVIIYRAVSCVNIYRAIRAMGRNSGWGATSQLAHNNYQLERKMLRTVVVMIAGFLVSWMPYTVLGLTGTVQGGLVVGAEVETFPALLAKLSAVWDPLIYLATNLQVSNTQPPACSYGPIAGQREQGRGSRAEGGLQPWSASPRRRILQTTKLHLLGPSYTWHLLGPSYTWHLLGPSYTWHLLGPSYTWHLLGPSYTWHLLGPSYTWHLLGPSYTWHLLGPSYTWHLLGPSYTWHLLGPSYTWHLLGPSYTWHLLGPSYTWHLLGPSYTWHLLGPSYTWHLLGPSYTWHLLGPSYTWHLLGPSYTWHLLGPSYTWHLLGPSYTWHLLGPSYTWHLLGPSYTWHLLGPSYTWHLLGPSYTWHLLGPSYTWHLLGPSYTWHLLGPSYTFAMPSLTCARAVKPC